MFVEQNLDTILAITERCYVMEKGRISTMLPKDRIDADHVRAQLLI